MSCWILLSVQRSVSKTRPQRPLLEPLPQLVLLPTAQLRRASGRHTAVWSRRSPPVRNRWAHLDTAVRLTPNCRAISAWDKLACLQ